MKKILIIPARRHSLEAYTEYLIRYLSDEFYFEMGYPPEPPYTDIRTRAATGATSPLEKNPDEFDLIYPHFTTHWFLEPSEKYRHKVALAFLEPGTYQDNVAVIGATSKPVEESFGSYPYHSLRFGVDTNLFVPFPMVRTDDLFHIGFVGNLQTPRRYLKELVMPLHGLERSRLMLFPTVWYKHIRPDEIERCGGQAFIDDIVDGDKWWSGFPNCYNQMDIYIRSDIDAGCQFTNLEAASCGVPLVTTDTGYGKEICEAGGGIFIDPTDRNLERIEKEIRDAVIWMRDHKEERKEMGRNARKFIVENYTWDKFTDAWREFFREGLRKA